MDMKKRWIPFLCEREVRVLVSKAVTHRPIARKRSREEKSQVKLSRIYLQS